MRALPGVEAAGVVRVLPLATTIGDYGLDVEGYEETPGAGAKGDWQIVSDGAFEAMGTRLVRGRWFTPADTSESQLVAVVNETLARQYFRDGNAVGGRLRVGNMKNPWADGGVSGREHCDVHRRARRARVPWQPDGDRRLHGARRSDAPGRPTGRDSQLSE